MFEFYVNMQKRGDGKVYADLHKTDERIYFTEEDALDAINDMWPGIPETRHVVKLVACLPEDLDFDEVTLYYGRLDGGGRTPYFESKVDLEVHLRTLLPGEDEDKRYSRVFFHRFLKEKT